VTTNPVLVFAFHHVARHRDALRRAVAGRMQWPPFGLAAVTRVSVFASSVSEAAVPYGKVTFVEPPPICRLRRNIMNGPKTYNGSCFCGAVQFTVTREPASMVKITRGEENIGTYNKTPQGYRKWCKTCGGHIFTEHPGLGLTDVYAAVIPDVPFIPGLHVNYAEATLPIRDGLFQLKDFPKEFGGSGIEVAE
jgi:hypothetical protein